MVFAVFFQHSVGVVLAVPERVRRDAIQEIKDDGGGLRLGGFGSSKYRIHL